ncbi:polymer-forming cytoskeletal protein [Paenibacillus sp. HB172176]|uniref:bactofilin family protein n=1 Tax=Paenibacillus sp. HB172176 TaxID=2493690 RepID=UPI00143C3115|nr:polymer-forming cytoskeletal protein [Paenibacillus sp. HB172176]
MFKSKSETKKINPDTTDTLIGVGTVFEGNLQSQASIRIEGKLLGDMLVEGDVTIGESGYAKSNITTRDLVLAGRLEGDVEAKGKLTICSTGVLNGNITAESFIIEAGGVFNGNSKMKPAASVEGEASESGRKASSKSDSQSQAS